MHYIQRKAVRSVSPMKKSKTCACFDGEISDGKSTMRLVIVAHLGCVVFLLRCRAVLCLSRSRAGRQRAKWIALLLARKSSPFTVVVVFHHLNVFCTRSLAWRRRLSSKSKSSHRIVSSSAATGGTCRSYIYLNVKMTFFGSETPPYMVRTRRAHTTFSSC